ncbi:LysR family transcriptional regulator [Martelella mangrovi]|uniref:DNA-binding transcriptional LysR family regulator n=1 Tax=Martelella mangrovi TaxID=1397477 RepID=A0ABV2ICD3_9HYPH
MQLQAIIYFNELVRSRSIRQAAEALGVSPMAVSRQLENLESYFDAPLVERGARGIVLTAAGTLLAERTLAVIRDLESARQVIDDLRGLKAGHVSLHVNGAVISAILAPALAEFYALYPAISIAVTVCSAEAAIRAVAAGETDLAVTMFSPPDIQTETLFELPVLHEPVMAPDHPLAANDTITPEAIREHAVAMPDRAFSIRRDFDARQRVAGFEPMAAAFETSSLELQKELARSGAAVLILPAMTVAREIREKALTVRPFEKKSEIATDIRLIRTAGPTPTFAASQLAEFLKTFLSRSCPTG